MCHSRLLLRQTRQCLARCQPRELGQELTARITGAARALRRRKEIAIRKINGATVGEVMRLFERDIVRMAVPALVFGCGAAAYVASLWQEGFTEKVSLAWYLFALCGLVMLSVIAAVVALNVRHAAHVNPVNSIKNE